MGADRITIYRNKDCARCGRIARAHKRFDWGNRIDLSTETPLGLAPLKMGEIVVEENEEKTRYHGIDAVRRIFRAIPAYFLARPFLWIPSIARKIDTDTRGCNDVNCAV